MIKFKLSKANITLSKATKRTKYRVGVVKKIDGYNVEVKLSSETINLRDDWSTKTNFERLYDRRTGRMVTSLKPISHPDIVLKVWCPFKVGIKIHVSDVKDKQGTFVEYKD